MYTLLLLAALAILPHSDVLNDRVDTLEVHHFYDPEGRLVFDQLIGWDVKDSREQVVFWRLIKSESQLPRRDWRQGGYVVLFQDGEAVTRCVRAPSFRERWTQFDVELENRESLPKEQRRELRGRGK